jgi:hypothetical protein
MKSIHDIKEAANAANAALIDAQNFDEGWEAVEMLWDALDEAVNTLREIVREMEE